MAFRADNIELVGCKLFFDLLKQPVTSSKTTDKDNML